MADRARDPTHPAERSLARDISGPPPQELLDRIHSTLGRRYAPKERWAIEMIHEKRLAGREHRLFQAHDRETGQAIAIKADSVTRRNREQYEALRNLRKQTEACVSPLFLARDDRFFAMQWVEAPLLARSLLGPERHEAAVSLVVV